MQLTDASSVPEHGQIVTVRQRRFAVSEVEKSTLPPPVLHGGQVVAAQHLVTLTSIEDDALGENLQVIWEVEQGARIIEKEALPEPNGFDSPQRLEAFLNAVRWGAVSSADTRALQAPFRSGIDLEDYQLDPLVRAVQMPRVNLLIADDVGLGKTIETGLVIQELIVRNRARTVLIVCPAGLQIHWRDQMRDKFGLEFRIVDSQLMKELRRSRGIHVNPWAHFPRLITSIDFLKRERPMRLMREALPTEATYPRHFDILVVDEAHNVAPSGRGYYAIDSLRTATIRAIAPHFEHKLFITATPHNGYQESFSALLELLDNQRFARGVLPNRAQLEAVMVRRLKSEITNWDGSPRFPQRHLAAIEVAYTDEERQVHRWLKEYTALRLQNAQGDLEQFAAEFVLKLLKKRLFSSPAAFAATLRQHEQTLTGLASIPARSRAGRPIAGILRRQIAQIEEDYADDAEYEEAESGAVDTASRMVQALSPHERHLLEQMRRWAEMATARRDCKTQAFIDWLRAIVKPNGVWSDDRVIVFTEYRATLNWLNEILVATGLAGEERLMTLYGGMDSERREAIKAAFQASPAQSSVRILLATDAASEGIDLQNYCHRLVHFEVPWNPNRMEQRNGRIDRHGQTHDPLIFHFVGQGYQQRALDQYVLAPSELEADLEFLMRTAEKVEQIRADLGKVGPVIAEQVEEAMLGRRRRLDTSSAEHEAEGVRRMLKFERNLRQQIEKHLQQLYDTQKELHLSPENIQTVVEVALELAGQLPLVPAGEQGSRGAGEQIHPRPSDGQSFLLPPLTGSWRWCADGLAHPHTGQIRPVVFDHRLAQGRDDRVLVHLNHRLVQMALRLLRAEVWSPEGRRGLHRVTAQRLPNHVLDTPAVIAHARLVIIGGDSHRLHEQVIVAGGAIQLAKERPFRRFNVGETEHILEAALPEPVSARMQAQLQGQWERIRLALLQALEARMKERIEGMTRLLAERAAKEKADIETILRELTAAIERELAEPAYRQLGFEGQGWSPDERSQLVRNIAALQARLAQIPAEIEAEQATIQARFADPQPRLFPVAVTFLVPKRLDR